MKKNIIFLFIITFILSSCWSDETNTLKTSEDIQSCSNPFLINSWTWWNLTLKSKVITNNIKNVISNNWWNIEYLNCEKWTKVDEKTLIAKIKPDYSDPNIQNLLNQTNMINSQISNTKWIINSTKSNFATQLNSLNIQKINFENQLKILNNSYLQISNQWDFWVLDIDKQLDSLSIQLDTLKTQVSDLNKMKSKLENSKKADLEKLQLNLETARSQVKTLFTSSLLQIDQIFWISDENRDKNDSFEFYLSAKNLSLKTKVENDWRIINKKFQNYDNLSNQEISVYLDSLTNLAIESKNAINNSIAWVYFTDATISSYYSIFIQYESWSLSAKNWIDNILKSIETVTNSYDTQILNIETQINQAQNSERTVLSNIDNLKSNKLGTYTTSIDLQKNQTKSQIETIQTNFSNIKTQIDSLKSQEEIQLNQLNNQLTQLNSSLNTININLESQSIYAETKWIIKEKSSSLWNKIWSNAVICQILPEKSSLKLQIYSSNDLSLPLDISFVVDSKKYTTQIITKLPYQDVITQNYVYETTSDIFLDSQKVDLSNILSEWKVLDVKTISNDNIVSDNKIYIPLDYVTNTINSSQVKFKTSTWWIMEKDVILGELNSSQVEIRNWLNLWDTICK